MQRYEIVPACDYVDVCDPMKPHNDGDWMLYEDHARVVEELEKENAALVKTTADALTRMTNACADNAELKARNDEKIARLNKSLGDEFCASFAVLHNGAVNALREELWALKERLAKYETGKPPAEQIRELFSYYDGCEGLSINHGLGPSKEQRERLIPVNRWIRRIAAIGEKEQEGEKGGKSE